MLLYHGSPTGGITLLRPSLSNHGKPYVYLTDCAPLALFYAHNPIERPGGFFPYWFDKAGQLHYDEYFPDQLRQMYLGHDGYVYCAEADNLPRLDKMPWVHLADADLPVKSAWHIPDLHAALLEAESAGKITMHRYESIPEDKRELHRRVVKRSLEKHPEEDSYTRFLRRFMPEIF